MCTAHVSSVNFRFDHCWLQGLENDKIRHNRTNVVKQEGQNGPKSLTCLTAQIDYQMKNILTQGQLFE